MEKLYATSADTNAHQSNTSHLRSYYLHHQYKALLGRKELPTFKARHPIFCLYIPHRKEVPTEARFKVCVIICLLVLSIPFNQQFALPHIFRDGYMYKRSVVRQQSYNYRTT